MQLPENHKNLYPARTKLAIRITNIIPRKVKIANLQNNLITHIITLVRSILPENLSKVNAKLPNC